MNKQLRLLACVIGLMIVATNLPAQKKTSFVFPATPFNEAETAILMEPGTATIKGIASLKKKGKLNFSRKGSAILLFPATPYFMEFIELKKKFNSNKKMATMSNEAFTYRIQGRYLDAQGGFEFSNLKPGKYCVITWIEFEKTKNITLRTGTRTYYNAWTGNEVGSDPIYSDYTYGYKSEDEVIGFVEVKNNGEVVNTVVSN